MFGFLNSIHNFADANNIFTEGMSSFMKFNPFDLQKFNNQNTSSKNQPEKESSNNNHNIDAIITTGGTGLTGRDSTPEAINEIADKIIEGFGELFRQISFNKIGTSTVQSRALGAVIKGTYVFALPGSITACKDAWEEILKFQLDNRYQPCNFIEIMPRLMEK